MSYVALEGRFVSNPKIIKLTDPEFRVWIRLLCWCAEQRTAGHVPDLIGKELQGATKSRLKSYVDVGLLDIAFGGGFDIHDWDEFNGTARQRILAKERKRAQRERDKVTDDTVTSHAEKRDNVTADVTVPATRARAAPPPTPKAVEPEAVKPKSNPPYPNPVVDVDLADLDERERILKGEDILHDLNSL